MATGLVLKKGRERAVTLRHHWIFSGAVEFFPEMEPGSICPVYSHQKELLGHAYVNKGSSILARMIAFEKEPPLDAIRKSLLSAINWRSQLFKGQSTTGYRLVNGEGDCLPGLIVDRYHDVLAIQIATMGMEQLKPFILEVLVKEVGPRGIFEKSNQPARKEERLAPLQQVVYGEVPNEIEIMENNLMFTVDICHGQKTGFFFDHREMRQAVKEISYGKRILNTFSYTGGFSAYAAAGDATAVHSVDISAPAIALAERNVAQNAHIGCEATFSTEDVFSFLRSTALDSYDLMILDPPAFAKRKQEVVAACRGYKEINRLAIQQAKPGCIILTCSCSYHVDSNLFQTVVFQAAAEAKRRVRIIGRHQMAADHPINLFHPEGDYLKSLWLQIE